MNPSNDYVMLDASLIKAHQQAATGKKEAKDQALRCSRGELTTKIHLLCDALGRPLRLLLTPGQAAKITSALALLAVVHAKGAIADRAYDANPLCALLTAGMKAVIPAKRNRKVPIAHDATRYREHNCIERCFNKLKHFRRITTRFDRHDTTSPSFLQLACTLLWRR